MVGLGGRVGSRFFDELLGCVVVFFSADDFTAMHILVNVISIHHLVVVSNIFYFHPYMGK